MRLAGQYASVFKFANLRIAIGQPFAENLTVLLAEKRCLKGQQVGVIGKTQRHTGYVEFTEHTVGDFSDRATLTEVGMVDGLGHGEHRRDGYAHGLQGSDGFIVGGKAL